MTNGVYDLASYPGCSTPYNGTHKDSTVHVVGFGTEHERLFRPSQRAEMVVYYNSFAGKVDLFHGWASSFCEQAVRDLFDE
jgi:hypothetical protein